jgi:hypothetical protein
MRALVRWHERCPTGASGIVLDSLEDSQWALSEVNRAEAANTPRAAAQSRDQLSPSSSSSKPSNQRFSNSSTRSL